MRDYRNLALDLLEGFKEYQIFVIPRHQNTIVDALAVAANTFKIPIHPNKKYEIEVKHRPAILDNVKYWQVFEDDEQINSFLTLSDEIESIVIDDDRDEEKIDETPEECPHDESILLTHIADKEIIQLKNNSFPKGLVPLEELFDHNDVAKNPRMTPDED